MNEIAENAQSVASAHRGPKAVPDLLWEPLSGGLLVLVPGLLGLLTGNVWLFPSLGPTAYLQAANPQHESARPYLEGAKSSRFVKFPLRSGLLLVRCREPL